MIMEMIEAGENVCIPKGFIVSVLKDGVITSSDGTWAHGSADSDGSRQPIPPRPILIMANCAQQFSEWHHEHTPHVPATWGNSDRFVYGFRGTVYMLRGWRDTYKGNVSAVEAYLDNTDGIDVK